VTWKERGGGRGGVHNKSETTDKTLNTEGKLAHVVCSNTNWWLLDMRITFKMPFTNHGMSVEGLVAPRNVSSLVG